MGEPQRRYLQTNKGYKKQAEAQERYIEKRESWQVFLPTDVSAEIKAAMPEGMSKAQYIKEALFEKASKTLDISLNKRDNKES